MVASAKWISGPSIGPSFFCSGDPSASSLCTGVLRGWCGGAVSRAASNADPMREGRPSWRTVPFECLAAQTEALDQRAVTLDVDALEVAQEPATLADQEQQAAAAVVVVLVLAAVLGEVEDALRQHRHLDLGGTGVALVRGVLGHDLLLDVEAQRHGSALLLRVIVARCARAGSPGLSGSAAGLRRSQGYQRRAEGP